MPTINITDKFGLNLSATPNPSSAFSKYLEAPSSILANLGSVQDISKLKISDAPFQSASAGLQFKQPVKLGTTGVELDIQPALQATVAVAAGGTGKTLFDSDDPFGDTIPIPDKQAYVSLAIQATLDLSANNSKIADLKFGFDNQSKVVFTDYLLFPASDLIAGSLTTLIEDYVIPGDIADIESMATGTVATVEGSGSLKLTAEADLPVGVNPLAAITETAAKGALTLKAGGSMTLKGALTLSGGYQIRIERQAARKFQLGYLKRRGVEFDVSVEASLGASATVGGIDLIQALIQIADPTADKDSFKRDGLTDEQISAINAAIKTGFEKSLQLSVSAEVDALRQSSTAFSYGIDLDQVDSDPTGAARAAINLALDGDLSGFETGSLPGVTVVRSVFSNLKQRKAIFKLNLLGIFSAGSVATLAQKGTLIVDPDSGAITIADKTTAQRIGFTSANFAKNGAKLRSVLADSTMITAAYRTSGTVPAVQFGSSQWFFEFHQKTSPKNIDDYLNMSQALSVPAPDQVKKSLADSRSSGSSLGQSAFNVSATYSDSIFRTLFLDANGSPRQRGDYDDIARSALQALIPGGDPVSGARRVPLMDSKTWSDLVAAYNMNATLITFFENHSDLKDFSAIIGSDFMVITWWSGAMSQMAAALAALLNFISKNPNWDPQDNQFKKLHQALNKATGSVAAQTASHFREPLGLLAMDIASSRQATTVVELSCVALGFKTTRQLTA